MNGQIITPDATYNLTDITLAYEQIELDFAMSNVSKSLQKKIDEQIEVSKKQFDEKWESKGKTISPWEEIKVFNQSLDVYVRADKSIDVSIYIGFHDSKNEIKECHVYIPVDLSGYEKELQSIVMGAIEERFF